MHQQFAPKARGVEIVVTQAMRSGPSAGDEPESAITYFCFEPCLAVGVSHGYTRAATSPPVVLTTTAPVSGTTSSGDYTYDSVGNRLSATGATYTNAAGSNRVQSTSGTLSRSYAYDSSGNVTSDGTRTFSYNDAGRMTSATKAGVTTAYALNGLGQRVKKTTSGTSTYFVYDEAGHLVGEYNNSGSLIEETVWLGDIPVATLRPNGGGVSVFYIHTDHLNTPRRISRPNDNVVVWRWDSDAFGTTAANEDPDADSTSFVYNLRFAGQYFDAETGLHYNYYRDAYDPATGRYTQADPIGQGAGVNVYLYVNANPTAWIDPFGLDKCKIDVDRALEAEGQRKLAEADKIRARFLGDGAAEDNAEKRIDELIQDYDDAMCCGGGAGKRDDAARTPRIPPTPPPEIPPPDFKP